jgi:hypothetical protein
MGSLLVVENNDKKTYLETMNTVGKVRVQENELTPQVDI